MGKTKKKRNNRSNKKKKSRTEGSKIETDVPANGDLSKDEELVELETKINTNADNATRKRSISDNESDTEEKPRKKKKKKPAVTEGQQKGKKSKRQMKREKFAERQAEAEAVAKDQLKSQCLSYLSQWKHNRQNWKFMKSKQVWLHKNKFSTSLVPDETWSLLLEYFESAQGNIRNMLLEDANKVIKQMDEWTEKNSKKDQETEEEETDLSKPDETSYKRARDLIQCLHE